MKKIIYILGIITLIFITIINLIFTANIDAYEMISINLNTLQYAFVIILVASIIYLLTVMINKYLYRNKNLEKENKIRKLILITSIIIYIAINIIVITKIRPKLLGDSREVYNLAKVFYTGNEQYLTKLTYAKITLREYMQAYHQQISMAFVFSLVFRIFHNSSIGLLRILNVISNIGIVFAIYKITKQISKKHEINNTLLFTLMLTFVTLPMYATFVYGDIPSISLCFWSVYYTMKYTDTKKAKYSIISSVFMMIAYMIRMNSLIFIIATVIYLVLNFFKEINNNKLKENLINASIIIIYIAISIIPSSAVKQYYVKKYNLDKSKEYPNASYFLMAMTESWRGDGWYSENIGEPALKNPEEKRQEYPKMIKEKMLYFIKKPKEAFGFYMSKIISMWSENTYSAARNIFPIGEKLDKTTTLTELYQKALVVLMCIISTIVLIQKEENIGLEVLFLITIFLGGFSFHILWEAKSRYIIPYVLALIPVASISIKSKEIDLKKFGKNIKLKVGNIVTKLKG